MTKTNKLTRGVYILAYTIAIVYAILALNHYRNVFYKQQDVIDKTQERIQHLLNDNKNYAELIPVYTETLATSKKLIETQDNIIRLQDNLIMEGFAESFSDWNIVEGIATAYSPYDDQNGLQSMGDPSVTSIGMTSGPKVMAVDPKKIPYYSEIIVICKDGTIITGVAGDTGGALRNNPKYQVDIFKQTFAEAVEFAKQDVTIMWREPKKDSKGK